MKAEVCRLVYDQIHLKQNKKEVAYHLPVPLVGKRAKAKTSIQRGGLIQS